MDAMTVPEPQLQRTASEADFAATEAQLLQRSPHAVILVDSNWHVQFANRQAVMLANKDGTDITGCDFSKAFPAFANLEAQQHCRRALEEQTEVEFEQNLPGDRWLQVCVCPQQHGVALYCRDITRFK